MNYLLFFLITTSLIFNRAHCDIFTISPINPLVSTQSNYNIQYMPDNDITPIMGSTLTITFPADYQGRLAASCSIIIDYWPGVITPTPICSFTNLVLTVNGLFDAGETYPGGNPFIISVVGPTNPYSTYPTGSFTLGLNLDIGAYQTTVPGITCTSGLMTCSVSTSPAQTNQIGKLIISFTTPEFPSDATITIQTDFIYWLRGQPYQNSGTQFIQGSTISCQPVLNSISGISCSFFAVNNIYKLTASNIVLSTINSSSISFSVASILSPPTLQPQGTFSITTYYNNYPMTQCTGAQITSVPGSITIGSFSNSNITVNAPGIGTLNFKINSNMIATDSIVITFPINMPLTSLTSTYISNGGATTNSPAVSGQSITLLGLKANTGDTVSISFTNIINPPSQETTAPFSITTYRNNYKMEASTGTITFSAYRSLITSATLSASSLQIGVSCTYTIGFTVGQPLVSSSAVVIALPAALVGKVTGCSPSTCTVLPNMITFTGLPVSVGSYLSLTLTSVINPDTLGATTSLTLYTLYNSTHPTSIVEFVNTGLTLDLIARASTNANAVITPSSSVVNNYPTTYTLTITNLNRFFAYTYMSVYIPTQITVGASVICQAGSLTQSCNFNSTTNYLVFSAFTSSLSAGELSSSSFRINNLINPPSTMPTSSFQIFFYNSNNKLVEYITSGLSVQMTTPASFSALSLIPSNTINSALTSLNVSFNVPSQAYQNNTQLVLTFPSVISLSNVDCSIISSNILAINQCSVYSNTVKVYISYSSLSTFQNTKIMVGPYKNYPSLQGYSIQVDLFGDTFGQSKLCSNANSPIKLYNTQLGAIGVSTFSFSNPILLSSSNLLINFANASSTLFYSMIIKFPPDFGLTSASCSPPSQVSCSVSSTNNMFNLTFPFAFSFPFTVTLTNIVTTAYTNSTQILIQTFSTTDHKMDQNSAIYFSTACKLPCKNCQSVSQPSICTACYSNASLNQISGAIYLNGSTCSSQCGLGFYLDASQNCLACSTNCLTCSAFSTCLTCNSSYLFNNSCLPLCPFTYYGSNFQCFPCPTLIFCKTCTDNDHCSSCINGYFYHSQDCLLICPSLVTYPDFVNNSCNSCPQNCTHCQGNNTLVTCTICNNGYVLDGTGCYLSCVTAGTYAVNGICQGCSSSCKTCSGTYTNCTSCYSNSTPYLNNGNCISICPAGYYADNSSYSCTKCVPPCQHCANSSIHSCLTCTTGNFLYNNGCMPLCPTNYYNSSGSCLACVSPCFTCTTELSCLSCTNSTYLYQNQCLLKCPASMAIINGNECLVCPMTCKTCSTQTTCTSCYNTSYLYNGTCLNICPTTTYANSTTGFCESCISPCLACSSLLSCISCIDNTKFLVNNICTSCNSPCLTCSLSISNCTSCLTNTSTPYYWSFSCIIICPSNYYSDNTTYQCSLCAYPCVSCSGPTNISCTSCVMGFYLLSNLCYATCPSTYFNNITVCSPCQTPCSTCSTAKDICTSCMVSKYLSGSSCVANCSTGMTVINNSICAVCSLICQTCLSANSSSCTSCYPTYFLQNFVCVSACPAYYYADANSSQCLACVSLCLTCQSISICLSCQNSSTLFLVNGSCLSCSFPCLTCSGLRTNCTSCNTSSLNPYLNGGTCITACPPTYYGSITFSCIKCSSPCNSCQNESTTYCLSCQSNTYFLSNMCYQNCPIGYFPNITVCSLCNPPCFSCNDANTCLSCIANHYLYGSNCVANCTSGMSIINGNTCQFCAPSCQTCSSSNISACTSCFNLTYLFGISCVTNCSSTFYSDSSVNKCMPCVRGCSTCQSATFCLSCLDTSLFLVNGTCVGCSSPCITCNGTVNTCTSCAVSTGFQYLLNNSCLPNCPENYYKDSILNICTKCIVPCQTCTSAAANSCITCLTGYLYHSGYCLAPCPSGFYSNGTNCLGCLSPCQNCYDALNCTSCASGNYLMGSQCVANCSNGTILVNNTYCQYCTGLCVTCLTANSSFCTSCALTQFLQWGNCVNICQNGYYGNSTARVCIKCLPPCDNCTSDTLCLSCFDTSLFLLNNSCVSCLSPCMTCSITRNNCTSCDQSSNYSLFVNNLCLSNCPTGYYASLNTCYRCNNPCNTCLSVSNSTCLTCLGGYVMLNSTGACLLNCPSGYYSNIPYCELCANNCSTCSSSSICLSCPIGLYLLGTTCTSSCPNGTISNNNSTIGGVCSYCNSPCTSCQTLNTSYCTSCPSNSFLANGQCLSNCSNGLYPNSGLWICSSCVNPCGNCTSPTQCLSCLDPTSFLMNFSCVGCAIQCLTCSSTISNCTTCNTSGTYPYFYSNTCVTGCPSTYYNDSSFVCKSCVSPCYTCSGPGNQSCLTCLVGYYQLGAICYTNCPSGYYNSANQCSACTAPCSTCTASGNNSCTSCQGGLYLLGSSCVNNCSGLATSGNTCVYCSANCNTCLTNNNTFCTSCTNGLYLFNGVCITNCSSGYYPDSSTFICMTCINNCSTCTSSTSCLSCRDSTLFLINTQCISCNSLCLTCSVTINNCTSCNTSSSYSILFGSTCLNSCPSTYYNNTPTTCAQCSTPCNTCTDGGNSSCITCQTGYYFYLNKCYSICPSTLFQNVTICSPCDTACYTCQNSAFSCVSCNSGFYLRGSTCVSNCSSGQVLINNTYCSVCLGNCLTCLSSNFTYCTSCSSGLYQLNGICYNLCPSYFYGNSSSNICIPCKIPCDTCSSDVACLSCNPSTPFLVNYTCVSCTSPCLTCQNTRTNCTSCNTASSFRFLLNFNCLETCPLTYFNDGTYNCVKCNSPCDTCTSSSNRSCLTCLPGYSQLGTDCHLNCPITYYSNGTYCLLCDLLVCKSCSITNNTCLSCANGLYLLGSLCNGSCPIGMIIYNGSICESCTNGCLTCLTSNDSFCTTCYTGNYLYLGTCSPTCQNYFFADSTSGTCKSCQSPCGLCLSISSCLTCLNPLYYLQNFTCVSSCTYPLIGINNACYQCSSQCLTCVQNVSTCLLCSPNFYYFPSSFSCSLYCSFFILRANQSNSGNNQCTQTCPIATFTDASSQYCQICPSGCKSCISLTNCTQCNTGYSYYLYLCYNPCPLAAPYSVNSSCIMCNIANCQTCLNSTFCSVCSSPYLLLSQGTSSSCISSCPSGYTYNVSAGSCVSNTANQTINTSNVVSSSLPPYTFLISTATLVFLSFILKFKYPQTLLALILFVSTIVTSSCCLINLLYIQIINLGSSTQMAVSTYMIFSSAGIQGIASLASFIAIIKIRDPSLIKVFKNYPVVLGTIMVLSIFDSNLFLLTITQLMNFDCFKIKYTSQYMQKLFKFSLSISIVTKCLNIAYSILQLGYYNAHATRLLTQTANFPINNAYTLQILIISCVTILIIIYLLYSMVLSEKVDNSKHDSNQSLIDDSHAFDKRNSSNSQLIFEVQSSDLIVDINSLKDQNQISETKRYKKMAKVTPDQMLEKMNGGIEQVEEKQQTEGQNVNKDTRQEFNEAKQEEVSNQIEFQDINNVFYFEQEDTRQNNNANNKSSKEQSIEKIDENKNKEDNNNIQLPVVNDEPHHQLNVTPQISDIIYNDHLQSPNQPSKFLQNEIQAIQDAINQKTKTQIINFYNFDNNVIKEQQQQKYSPSQLSKYQPNKKIQQEFAHSYFDDANKFNEHNEEMKKSGQFINFQVENKDYNEFGTIQEISFQKRQNFQTIEMPEPQQIDIKQAEPQQVYKKTEWDDILDVQPQQAIIKIDEEQQFNQYTLPQKITPMKNSFFEMNMDQNNDELKPSQGLKGKIKKHRNKPDIPLPKNQIEKEIMNIYQKKDKKQLPPRKKRYQDNSKLSKMENEVQYSIEDKDFLEEKGPFKPIFSGQIKRQMPNRYNQSRASNQQLYDDEQLPQKPSVHLRKSSFKKIGEMVLEQSQSSARK